MPMFMSMFNWWPIVYLKEAACTTKNNNNHRHHRHHHTELPNNLSSFLLAISALWAWVCVCRLTLMYLRLLAYVSLQFRSFVSVFVAGWVAVLFWISSPYFTKLLASISRAAAISFYNSIESFFSSDDCKIVDPQPTHIASETHSETFLIREINWLENINWLHCFEIDI